MLVTVRRRHGPRGRSRSPLARGRLRRSLLWGILTESEGLAARSRGARASVRSCWICLSAGPAARDATAWCWTRVPPAILRKPRLRSRVARTGKPRPTTNTSPDSLNAPRPRVIQTTTRGDSSNHIALAGSAHRNARLCWIDRVLPQQRPARITPPV